MSETILVLATQNRHKAQEIRQIWSGLHLKLLTLADFDIHTEVEETGETLEANALIKARFAHAQTGRPAVADDTGLEVDALGGAPGVYAARYAGENVTYMDNNLKLLAELGNRPPAERKARFRTAVALVNGPDEVVVEGVCEGEILTALSGDGGFGYDPLFYVPGLGKSFAQMTPEEKNGISHRGQAFRAMGEVLRERFR